MLPQGHVLISSRAKACFHMRLPLVSSWNAIAISFANYRTAAQIGISGKDDAYHFFLYLSVLAELNCKRLTLTRRHGLLRILSMTP